MFILSNFFFIWKEIYINYKINFYDELKNKSLNLLFVYAFFILYTGNSFELIFPLKFT
jgi:hypothetical protein